MRTPLAILLLALGLIACTEPDDPPEVQSESSELLSIWIPQSVATGGAHSCAIVGGGRVRCWGYNAYGQLGNGTWQATSTPTLVSGITDAVALSAGRNHTCALRSNNQIKCWGYNTYGQLGNGSTGSSSVPVNVSGITTALTISAGGNHTCAVLADSTARCWGLNVDRQLGNNGSTTSSSVPVTVQAPGSPALNGIVEIAAGGYHTCASLSGGGARCWGYNGNGQLGNGTTSVVTGHATVALGSEFARTITTGVYHSCAGMYSGQARCWGYNLNGQLGTGSTSTSQATPSVVRYQYDTVLGPRTAVLTGVNLVDAGESHSCMVTTGNVMYCAGANGDGRLGLGVTSADWRNMRAARADTAAVAAGGLHTCSRQLNGEVYCYGTNGDGQAGKPGPAAAVTPHLAFVDVDNDAFDDRSDNCPTVANFDQLDTNVDGQGDACECLGVTCTASDSCHLAGTCAPATGTCSDPVNPVCEAPPVWPPDSALIAAPDGAAAVELTWTEATHHGGIDGYRLFQDGVFLIELPGGQTAHTVGGLTSGVTYLFEVEARHDIGGTSTDGPSTLVSITPPVTAPPIGTGSGTSTSTADAAEHLYIGPGAVQTGVDPADLDADRIAVIRGLVTTRAGAPMDGARVVVKDHEEYGETTTRPDGTFAMAVNGGEKLVVVADAVDHFPAHREVEPSWGAYTWIEDIALVSYAGSPATTITMGAGAMQHARGNVETDGDGTRRATVLIPPGTQAKLVDADGTETPMTSLTVRATEYTVGVNGVRAMPAPLPPQIAYTYAVELSADEAIQTGASRVQFDRALAFYVDNFLDFGVGRPVPMGYYDRDQAAWISSTNGLVVAIVSETAGAADLDLTGNGVVDAADTAIASMLGISASELQRLATLYDPGQELWRVPVTHFTPWDSNWGSWPPDDMEVPYMSQNEIMDEGVGKGCEQSGSIINCENQSLGEEIELTGTPFALHYESRRAFGRDSERTVVLPLTGATVPASCLKVHARFLIAGRRVEETYGCAPNQRATFTWDGYDTWGRQLRGSQSLTIQLGYEYSAAAGTVSSFGGWPSGGEPSANRAARTFTIWNTIGFQVGGSIQVPSNSIGGWSLDAHHHVDPASSTLYRGDGSAVKFGRNGRIDTQFSNTDYWGYGRGLAMSPEGGVYYPSAQQLMRRNRDGSIEHIAGVTGVPGCGGEGHGGPAVDAKLGHIYDVAVGTNGVVYAATQTFLWRIVPGGTARVIAVYQSGSNCMAQLPPGTTVPATLVTIERISVRSDGAVAVLGQFGQLAILLPGGNVLQVDEPWGSNFRDVEYGGDRLYVAGYGAIFLLNSDDFVVVAGNPAFGNQVVGEGVLAKEAGVNDPHDLTYRDGSLYFSDDHGRIIRRIRGGYIKRVAGVLGQSGEGGDGGEPLAATLVVHGMVATANDALVFHQFATVGHKFRRITFNEELPAIPSEDGGVVYQLAGDRRHVATVDSRTGVPELTFGYDGAGRLHTVTDPYQNVVTINRDVAGHPTSIVGPLGHVTALTVDANGYLRTVTNPEGETITLEHDDGGLLESMIDPKGYAHSYDYDHLGRLTVDNDPIGYKTLLRLGRGYDATVHVTTQLGTRTTYETKELNGAAASVCPSPVLGTCTERKVTRSDGSFTLVRTSPNGLSTMIMPDGTRIDALQGPDPRFGTSVQRTQSMTVTPAGGSPYTATYETLVELYDPDDLLSVKKLTERATVGGGTSQTVWDGDTMSATTTTAEGRTTTEFYDSFGRAIRTEIPGILPREYFYDARGRLDRVTQGDRLTSYQYHPQSGFVQSISMRTSGSALPATYEVSSQTYDGVGRSLSSTDAAGVVSGITYDDNGNARTVTPPGRPTHTYSHGPGDLPEAYVPPPLPDGLPRNEQYFHDNDGRPDRTILPDGRTVIFEHEAGTGRLKTTRLADWGTITVDYGPASRVDSIVRDDSMGPTTVEYTYDGPDVAATELSHAAVAGTVAYDRSQYQSQRRITETVNGQHSVLYTYDRDQFLTSAGALTVVPDPGNGSRTSSAVGSVAETRTYNGYGDPEVVTATAGATPLLSRTYAYQPTGRIDSITESIGGGAAVFRRYRYNLSGRLEAVLDAAGTPVASYTYDANGNRTSAPGVAPGTISVDDHDRLLTYGTLAFTYTRNGEVATRTEGAAVTSYTWDTLGALRRVVLPSGGPTIEYLVDPAGKRIGKLVNGALAYGFLYNGADRPAAQLTGGVVTSRYVYSRPFGAPDYMVKNGTTYAFVTDHHGSVRMVVDTATGVVHQQVEYDEFGRVVSDSAPGFQPFGYAGGLYDHETGLVQFGAREYDARIGRWMSRDALGFVDTGNVYEYVGSDPINLKDPDGNWGWPSLEDISNLAAGFGDRITFGGTAWIRRQLGIDDVVDKCSGWYMGGGIAGDLVGGYLMGVGAARLVGAAANALTVCKNSFTAGTLVRTPDGLVAIETLAPGDLVLARDDQTGDLSYQPVHHVIVTADKQTFDLRLRLAGVEETLGVTSDHPFWREGQGWTKAGELAPGDRVFTESGDWATVVGNAPGARQAFVYNLVVDDDHTFFVGETGAWVHNCKLIVAATARLEKLGQGYREAHKIQANKQLIAKMVADPKFKAAMRKKGITIPLNANAKRLAKSPGARWTWHHVANKPGVMQLIPRSQHWGSHWKVLHPGNVGGFARWGHLF